MKDIIHFAHGNGFPSSSYQQLLNVLKKDYELHYIDKVGHHPDYPVTENWHLLVQELIHNIEKISNKPVIAVGHSLGGVLSFMAAMERPSLFKAVVMIDSPLINRFKSRMVKIAKKVGIIDRVTPAHRTRGRRHFWPNKQALWDYLKTRPLFKSFTDACLSDYIEYGCETVEDGVKLCFDKNIEYQIYRTIPHILPQYEGMKTVPTALIMGDKSTVVEARDVRYMQEMFDVKCYKTPGTHMIPMEHPEQVGKLILQVIKDIVS